MLQMLLQVLLLLLVFPHAVMVMLVLEEYSTVRGCDCVTCRSIVICHSGVDVAQNSYVYYVWGDGMCELELIGNKAFQRTTINMDS